METVFVGLVIVYTLQMSHQDIRIYLPMRIRSSKCTVNYHFVTNVTIGGSFMHSKEKCYK